MLGSSASRALVDIADLHRRTDAQRAGIGLFLARQHAEQRGLARAVGADDADDAAGRQLEVDVFIQQPVVIALGQIFGLDHQVAQPLGHRDHDGGGALRAVPGRLGDQLFIGIDARLGLGLARLGRLLDPFAFARDGALLGGFLAGFLLQALFLHFQEGRIIAFVRNALAAVQLQDPRRDIVQEIAVMGDQDHAALVFAQGRFQPFHAFGIQMVGGFVQQQDVGRVQQQLAQRHAAALAARQGFDIGVAIGTAQRVHRLVDLAVQVPQALGLDLVLQLRHLVGGLVGIVGGDLVVAVDQRLLLGDAFHDVFAHILGGIQLRLLRDSPCARRRPPRPRR